MSLAEALEAAAELNAEVARVVPKLGRRIEDGTVPGRERLRREWGQYGEATAGEN